MNIVMLIVEDDEGIRQSLEKSFVRKGYETLGASSVSEACRILLERKVDTVLLDMRLPDGSGLEVLSVAREVDKEIDVIMMTAFPEVTTAVRALKEGARDYIVKPFELEGLQRNVERTVEARRLRQTVRHLEREKGNRKETSQLLGVSPAIEKVQALIQKVARNDTAVLIMGETGTGKEIAANAIHALSPRRDNPLVKVNCSTFSEHLLDSELFGHEKGAFTDAKEARAGLFEMVDGGTLFLDEITEMKPGLQAKLLRVLEGEPFRRVGGQREIQTDVRILSATNRNLKELTLSGEFREDLYYRLDVFRIEMPLLKDRGDDVLLLARFFLDQFAEKMLKGKITLSKPAEALLMAYSWRGNIRELRNMMERATILCEQDEIGPEHLPGELHSSAFIARAASNASGKMPSLVEIEHSYIAHVLECVGGNLSEASRILGIARNTLRAKTRGAKQGVRQRLS